MPCEGPEREGVRHPHVVFEIIIFSRACSFGCLTPEHEAPTVFFCFFFY